MSHALKRIKNTAPHVSNSDTIYCKNWLVVQINLIGYMSFICLTLLIMGASIGTKETNGKCKFCFPL